MIPNKQERKDEQCGINHQKNNEKTTKANKVPIKEKKIIKLFNCNGTSTPKQYKRTNTQASLSSMIQIKAF